MSTSTELIFEPTLLADDDVEHFICCMTERSTYCGRIDSVEADGYTEEVSCTLCMHADEVSNGICPVMKIPCNDTDES